MDFGGSGGENGNAGQTADLTAVYREVHEFKRVLFRLALSFIGATVLTYILMILYYELFPVLSGHPDRSMRFFFIWLENNVLTALPSILIYAYVFRGYFKYEKPGEPYVFKKSWVLPLFFAGYFTAAVASLMTTSIADVFTSAFGGEGLPDVFADILPQSNTEFLIMLLMVGIVAPIYEEVIFRHLLLKPLRRFGDLQAIIITSLMFGFFHANFTQFLYAAAVGFIYGVVAVRANSVIPAIALHIFQNVLGTINTYLLGLSETGAIPVSAEMIGGAIMMLLILGLVSLIVFAVKRRFHVENQNPYIRARERVRIIVTRPYIIILFAFLVAYTVMGTSWLMG